MNKKGFTITELLAVIVILGILTSLASVGVTRYRQSVKEKELINLHSTIETGFDDYRSKLILSGDSVEETKDLCEGGELLFDISYNGNRLKCGTGENDVTIKEAKVTTKIKGDLLLNNKAAINYKTARATSDEETMQKNYIEDGTCMVTSSREPIKDESGKETGEYEIVKKCQGTFPNYTSSKEEITCVYLETNSEVLINDYEDENSLCQYWKEAE